MNTPMAPPQTDAGRRCRFDEHVFARLRRKSLTSFFAEVFAVAPRADYRDWAPSVPLRTLGKKPFGTATYVAFALFPIADVLAERFASLVVAFMIRGLRELGEPTRKTLIVDFAAGLSGRAILSLSECGEYTGDDFLWSVVVFVFFFFVFFCFFVLFVY